MIGKFRQKIKIFEITRTPDGIGGHTTDEDLIHDVWGDLKPANAHEIWKADQLRQKVTHILNTRFISNLKTEMRIKYDGRDFDIIGIVDLDERKRFLKLTLEEGLKK